MAKGEVVEPREIVKANNELFRCNYKIKDLVANRIFMAFASLVDHNDVKENQNFIEYKIPAGSIIPNDVDSGGKYETIREAAGILLDQRIEQKLGKTGFVAYTLFSKISYENGIITGGFHTDLIPFFIIARERFTKMKLSEYMQLPSIYSQCIFGFLKSWDDKKEVTVKLSQLHEMLNSPASFRKDFYELKRRVLDKAHKDINEKTSLSYEWEPIKNGRLYAGIRFIFTKKAKSKSSKGVVEIIPSEPDNQITLSFNGFLEKFPDGNHNRFAAFPVWSRLNEKTIAPIASDVPEDNKLGVLDFLATWEKSHNTNEAD